MKKMKKIVFILLAIVLLTGSAGIAAAAAAAAPSSGEGALKIVQNEISAVIGGRSKVSTDLGRRSSFHTDLKTLLTRYKKIASPKPVYLENQIVKWLVPLELDGKTVGGFFQVSADQKMLISFLPWDAEGKPLFRVSRDRWESVRSANDLPELAELIPLQSVPSPGVPVEPEDVQDLYLIEHLEQIPSKTQEELKVYADKHGLSSALGRRTGSSKCMSYAAGMASDWWKIVLGKPIGKYVSFVHGGIEYGMNPRIIEAMFFQTPASPYTFKKLAGKDRVTGEKIPYSPKHFAYIMSWLQNTEKVEDPLKKGTFYQLPKDGFGIKRPFYTVFNKTGGKVGEIRESLERYGILLGQHTSRLLGDKISLRFQGVHGVNIVGTGRYKGKEVVLYYETFGKNHRDYLEDSFYGPRLRAFPVKFFYQGIAFPHQILVKEKISSAKASFQFTDEFAKPITVDKLELWINGRAVSPTGKNGFSFSISEKPSVVLMRFKKKYFQTPEEPEFYERIFFVSSKGSVEMREYEAVVTALADEKRFLGKLFGKKRTSFNDFLRQREEQLRIEILKTVKGVGDSQWQKLVFNQVHERPNLLKSDLGKQILALEKFAASARAQ